MNLCKTEPAWDRVAGRLAHGSGSPLRCPGGRQECKSLPQGRSPAGLAPFVDNGLGSGPSAHVVLAGSTWQQKPQGRGTVPETQGRPTTAAANALLNHSGKAGCEKTAAKGKKTASGCGSSAVFSLTAVHSFFPFERILVPEFRHGGLLPPCTAADGSILIQESLRKPQAWLLMVSFSRRGTAAPALPPILLPTGLVEGDGLNNGRPQTRYLFWMD
ncbi:uncharacterized protein LOC105734167 isoform X3 [Aotus nancymaae]|uniref:uncharacterized protein LOC105734167 isoform X3 n=1 Tax=Aotus nancymaae TaxID=37293 RepID=UPI0030FF0F30